jgi:hypothetical protein
VLDLWRDTLGEKAADALAEMALAPTARTNSPAPPASC